MTSHDVVGRLRRLAGQKQVGHTGTLDPIATGLMICVLGRATKLSPFLTHLDKSYLCDARFGVATDTYDSEGEVTARSDEVPSDIEIVRAEVGAFVGDIEQTPPVYSAIKVAGKALHRYARAGEAVNVPSRQVRVDRFELVDYSPPDLRFVADVSAGAYIRSLCHDLGQALGCGAHMTALRRTSVGPFSLDDAVTLDELEARPELLASALRPMGAMLPHLPHWEIDETRQVHLLNGSACPADCVEPAPKGDQVGGVGLAIDGEGNALALVKILDDLSLRPTRVLEIGR